MKRLIKCLLLTICMIASITPARSWPDPRYYDVVWDGSRYLLAGENGLFSSADAKSWKSIPNPVPSRDTIDPDPLDVYSLATNGSVTVALAWRSTFIRIAKDTLTPVWLDDQTSIRIFESIYWTGKEFVAIGNGDSLAHSPDGLNWKTEPYKANFGTVSAKVVRGDSGMLLLSHDTAYRSQDGMSWSPIPTRSLVHNIAWIENRYILVGDAGLFAFSTNTKSWFEDSTINASIGAMSADFGVDTCLWDVAKLGDRFLLLTNAGIMSTDDFGGWQRLLQLDIPAPSNWIVAGNRAFCLWRFSIWSTADGKDTLIGVIDTSSSLQSPQALGIQNRRTLQPKIDARGLHLEFAQPTDVRIDLFDTRGRLQSNIARGFLEAGSHEFAIPRSGTAFLRIQSNRETSVVPLGVVR